MKKTFRISIIAAAVASLGVVSGAAFANSSDIVAKQLRATSAKAFALPGMTLSRDTVQFSWNLDGAEVATPSPFVTTSREYFVDASAADLRGGIALKTSGAGSIIKLTPRSASGVQKSQALTTDDILVRVGGRVVSMNDFSTIVDDSSKFASMAKSGISFAPGSLAFQINPALGSTNFELALKNGGGDYLVHVFEPASTQALTLTTTREAYLTGEFVSVRATGVGADVTELSGGIASPSGEITAMTFARQADGSFTATAPLTASTSGALFEAFAAATMNNSGNTILRDAKVGFAVGDATARSMRVTRGASASDVQSFDVAMDVSAPGRYSTEAVLYGVVNGKRAPIAMTQTGAWLDAGTHTMSLRFDNLQLDARNISGPFTLGHMVVKNQGSLQVIERRAEVAMSERTGNRGAGTSTRGVALD
jgi:hypothetical protein